LRCVIDGLPDTGFLTHRPFAHRGLHGANLPENSLAAARSAIAAGFGIECDVRLSADGVPLVFHDVRLERLTKSSGRTIALDAATLGRLKLNNGNCETIPTLAALLALTGRDTPLLIELKPDPECGALARLCRAVAALLDAMPHNAAIMSFDARAVSWFARHRPRVVRGMVLGSGDRPGLLMRGGEALAIRATRPHFMACDVRDLPTPSSLRLRRAGRPVLTWTVRSDVARYHAARHADQIIFERI
jgi:glycerophosphoryl diester phosphodiesterase